MDLILLGLGGALGSLTRFGLGNIISQKKANTAFPMGTFSVNITGALLLGLVSGIQVKGNMYLLLADGFLGAYTTFSTFMYEGINLFGQAEPALYPAVLHAEKISFSKPQPFTKTVIFCKIKKQALYYVLGTLILGIVGYIIGFGLGKLIIML